jgi:hypothetical protein
VAAGLSGVGLPWRALLGAAGLGIILLDAAHPVAARRRTHAAGGALTLQPPWCVGGWDRAHDTHCACAPVLARRAGGLFIFRYLTGGGGAWAMQL